MRFKTHTFVVCTFAILLGGAAPYAESGQRPHGAVALKAYAEQAKRKWLQDHPDALPSTITNPVILSGNITAPMVNVQQATPGPSIQAQFKGDKSGVSYLEFGFTNAAGTTLYADYDPGNYPDSGNITFVNTYVNSYQPSGTYTLSYIYIVGDDGGYTEYSASQAAALFPTSSLQVTNANPGDVTPPSILGGKIKTPTVKLSSAKPLVELDLTISDNASGVVSPYVYVGDPNGNIYFLSGQALSPITTKAVVPVGVILGSAAVTGTWTIETIVCQDRASNETFITDPATITQLFGANTFQVAN